MDRGWRSFPEVLTGGTVPSAEQLETMWFILRRVEIESMVPLPTSGLLLLCRIFDQVGNSDDVA